MRLIHVKALVAGARHAAAAFGSTLTRRQEVGSLGVSGVSPGLSYFSRRCEIGPFGERPEHPIATFIPGARVASFARFFLAKGQLATMCALR